jgi:hypothetical protein
MSDSSLPNAKPSLSESIRTVFSEAEMKEGLEEE